MNNLQTLQPRAIRLHADPLGSYIRVARGDGRCVQNFLEVKGAHFHGVVIDATRVPLDKELRDTAAIKRIDVVLDPKTQESATEGAFNSKLAKLPWGADKPHAVEDFEGSAGKRRATAIAEFVKDNGFTKVLTPSHFVRSHDDDWFDVDLQMADRLREALDRVGASTIPIAYSLAIPYSVLRDTAELNSLVERIGVTTVDEIWLRVDGFGSDASPTGVKNYIEAGRGLHGIGKPLIADHVGGLVGISLLAFGGVGGLSHGVTLRERFSAAHWFRVPSGDTHFGPHHRVYFPELDIHLEANHAQKLLESSMGLRARIGCRDTECCPRAVADMIAQPGRHFLNQRAKQFSRLSEVPGQLRTSVFLEEFLRKASDHAMAVSNMRIADTIFSERMLKQRLRLDALRETLGVFAERKPPNTFSALPQTRVVRESTFRTRSEDRRPSL
jgi:hypothetical protein